MIAVRGATSGIVVLATVVAWQMPAAAKTATRPPPARDSKVAGTHVVQEGQSLWTISRSYGCEVDELKRANRLDGELLQIGQQLKLPKTCRDAAAGGKSSTSSGGSPAKSGLVVHQVKSGDTLYALALQYDSSVDNIRARNGLGSNLIRVGQRIDVVPGSKELVAILGQSKGSPSAGRLLKPTRLADGAGYHIRRPERAFGANHMVFHIRRAVRAVRRKHPKVHTLAIGDLSDRNGGKITMHRSHQSGRDVDLGLYFQRRPKGYPTDFVSASAKNLDFQATWTLLKVLVATANTDTGIERIFLDYGVQGMLYKWAKRKGVSPKVLSEMFQYPNGRGSASGLIRHEPGHADHLHVRFKCPAGDEGCR